MPLISGITAKTLVLVDALSSYFITTSVSIGNYTDCGYLQTNMTTQFTPLGEQVLSFIMLVLVDSPLSIIQFWLPVLNEVLRGLLAISGS